MEFEPLGSPDSRHGDPLHEVGYWSDNHGWNYPSVYSLSWRVYYDYGLGHYVRFGDQTTALGPKKLLVIPNLQAVNHGWPALPEAVKSDILARIRAQA